MKEVQLDAFAGAKGNVAPDRLITKAEVAAYVRKTTRTIDAWMAAGILPYYKIGRSVLFKLSDVQQHLDQNFRVNRLGGNGGAA